jgi:hypothetical protein
MSCPPSYNYTPEFETTPAGQEAPGCTAPTYTEHRARLFAGGTYFRSKLQGDTWNDTTIQVVDNLNDTFTCTVSHPHYPAETYAVSQTPGALPEDPCTPNGITGLRAAINANSDSIVEMYVRATDVLDTGSDDPCLSAFTATQMSGGSGAPTDDAGLAAIRTGPARSIIIVGTHEDINGNPVLPPPSRRVQQWNGIAWTSYCNASPGECPGEGTC